MEVGRALCSSSREGELGRSDAEKEAKTYEMLKVNSSGRSPTSRVRHSQLANQEKPSPVANCREEP
eukprot:1158426-Pelagomonas_calceolata.AAC.21